MMRKVVSRGVGIAAIISLAISCAYSEPGTPSVEEVSNFSSVQEPSTKNSSSYPIPKELDVASFMSAPCELAPVEALKSLGYEQEGVAKTEGSDAISAWSGPSCSWSSKESNTAGLTVVILVGNSEKGFGGIGGLRSLYESGDLAYWEDASVLDYPAAYAGVADLRGEGECGLSVGMSGDMAISVVAGPYFDDPARACPDVEEVATAMVRKLKEGN